jgi:myo-inositol-1(or 4)-monophosphatase
VHPQTADLELLKSAALEAGALAMTFFRKSPSTWSKAGGSIVSEADMAVDNLLRDKLTTARPDYGWLSEETADDPARHARDTIFVVDPIDGTRGFLEGDERWCVSLAIVRHGRPTVAALYAPARAQLFTAIEGSGARLAADRISVSAATKLDAARLAGPRGWLRTDAVQRLGADLQPHVPSLAYRFTSVAAGWTDAAFASPRSNDWDLAACDLLVHEAGGRLTGLDGEKPRYNRENVRHGVLAAANESLHPLLLALVAEAEQEVGRGLPAKHPGKTR